MSRNKKNFFLAIVLLLFSCCILSIAIYVFVPSSGDEPSAAAVAERSDTEESTAETATDTAEPEATFTSRPENTPLPTDTIRPTSTVKPTATKKPAATPSLSSAMKVMAEIPIKPANTYYIQDLFFEVSSFLVLQDAILEIIEDQSVSTQEVSLLKSYVEDSIGVLDKIPDLGATSEMQTVHQFVISELPRCYGLMNPIAAALRSGGQLTYDGKSCYQGLVNILEVVVVYEERHPGLVLEEADEIVAVSTATPESVAVATPLLPTATIPLPTATVLLPTATVLLPTATTAAAAGQQVAVVTNIVDGDTIDVSMNGQTYRVRYIGMDTPEYNQTCGTEATQANAALVAGKTVTMVRDVSETDQYGRLLRYVYVGSTFVNGELVAGGWAVAKDYPPDTAMSGTLHSLEAQGAGKGCDLVAAPLPTQPSKGPDPVPIGNCDPSYPTVCIPPYPPDLNCGDIPYKRFQVLPPDPHGFDKDNDGVGCES